MAHIATEIINTDFTRLSDFTGQALYLVLNTVRLSTKILHISSKDKSQLEVLELRL